MSCTYYSGTYNALLSDRFQFFCGRKRAPAWEDVLSRNFLGSVDGKVGNILADELAVIG
jgi:hypothetical protein